MSPSNAPEEKLGDVDLDDIVSDKQPEETEQPTQDNISVEQTPESNEINLDNEQEVDGFQELKNSEVAEKQVRDIDFLLDIPLEVSVELGRTKLLINDLLRLSQGSVIELNKVAGEPMEILINQKLIARGEVVVVNEKFGVRLTDILSPMERVQKLV